MLRALRPHEPDPEPTCPLGRCDGSGWLLDEEAYSARPCTCRDRRVGRAGRRSLGSGIPKRFRGVSFERKPICDLEPSILREIRHFVARLDDELAAGRGLWLFGEVGTGKTSLAMLVSKTALESGHSVAIYSVPTLLAEIKSTYDRDADDSYMRLFRRLCSVDLLHLDDLGSERTTEWVLEQLYSIVNERWQNQRSMIVTTNLNFGQLREQIGARTVSRLAEVCEQLLITGPDLRIVGDAP